MTDLSNGIAPFDERFSCLLDVLVAALEGIQVVVDEIVAALDEIVGAAETIARSTAGIPRIPSRVCGVVGSNARVLGEIGVPDGELAYTPRQIDIEERRKGALVRLGE